MAGETEPQAAAAPQIDLDALAARLQQAAAQGTQAAIEGVARRQQHQQAAAAAAAATQADPVASTIMPIIAPALRELAIKGDSGRDAAVFYATTPAAHRFSGQIESRFNDLAARNIPVDRASIWNLIKGEQGLTPGGLTFDEAIKQRDEEVKRAQEATTVRGSRGTPTAPVRDPYSMTPDELASAIDGVAF